MCYGDRMDVTEVILRDHEWFRRQFIALFDLYVESAPDVAAIAALWDPLAARLDVHAAAEPLRITPEPEAAPAPVVPDASGVLKDAKAS